VIVAVCYTIVLAGLAIFGAHRLALTALSLRASQEPFSPQPLDPEDAPSLLLQLPVYNEANVVERLLEATRALRYPRDRLTVQVLDDSNDETSDLVAATLPSLVAAGVFVQHVRRPERAGFKAGALAYGMAQVDSELIAIFDADFVPHPDFFERTVPYFQDRQLGCVQARWEHLNRDQSLLTRLQATLLDAHFRVEQRARSRSGRFFNFNGTAGLWRRAAIEDAGGWDGRTLTEDLDLSLRAQLTGWRFRYLDEVAAPSELPTEIASFRSQQHRWVKGSGQNARRLLKVMWTSPEVRLAARVEASFQLLLNAAYPLVCLLSLLSVPLVATGLPISTFDLYLDLGHVLLVALASASVCVFYLSAQRDQGARRLLETCALMPVVLALGVGMALMNSAAYLSGWAGRRSPFVRTPKRGDGRRRYGARRDLALPCGELALGVYLLAGALVAAAAGRWLAVPFMLLLCSGFLGFGGATLLERRRLA
jgi:cellulose synthase/poly-beta-1,6-N-acetylglucosamine synthase-like glycosyltransferase